MGRKSLVGKREHASVIKCTLAIVTLFFRFRCRLQRQGVSNCILTAATGYKSIRNDKNLGGAYKN